jgi:hypothetical protein
LTSFIKPSHSETDSINKESNKEDSKIRTSTKATQRKIISVAWPIAASGYHRGKSFGNREKLIMMNCPTDKVWQ